MRIYFLSALVITSLVGCYGKRETPAAPPAGTEQPKSPDPKAKMQPPSGTGGPGMPGGGMPKPPGGGGPGTPGGGMPKAPGK
jgi:hypothetical protein